MKYLKNILFLLLAVLGLYACEEVLFEEDISDKAIFVLAPKDGVVLTQNEVNFTWREVEGASQYEVQVATPNFDNAEQFLANTTLDSTFLSLQLPEGDYTWRVRGINENYATQYELSRFKVELEDINEDISNDTVVLIAPSNGSVLAKDTINFSWESLDFAEEYRFQIATPNFDNPTQLISDEVLAETNISKVLDDGVYEWRVKAQNSSSETGYSTYSFTVETQIDFQNREVILISPPDNFISNQTNVNLQWLPVSDAISYRIQVIDPSDSSIVTEFTTEETDITVSFPEGMYSWRVRAERNNETTDYFSRLITIDSEVPNVPILETPADGDELLSTDVTFTWSRKAMEGTVEKDSLYVYLDMDLTNKAFGEEVSNETYTTTLSNNQTYYWFMKAFDEAGNESDDSAIFSFSINE